VRGQFSDLLAQGFKEIVFTGIRLGAYGRNLAPPTDLSSLLLDLLSLPGSWRLRLGSLEPQDISPSLLTVLQASPRWCRHLHLPLQNGDDEILASMGRPYRAEDYRSLLSSLVQEIPQIALGADIIVGFPGETEAHFLRTLRFLEAAPLSYLHIFPFSPRPGTAAALLPHTPS
jgi:threonylcarbamoyladenosine tRNA methylthiotransferase MtaB